MKVKVREQLRNTAFDVRNAAASIKDFCEELIKALDRPEHGDWHALWANVYRMESSLAKLVTPFRGLVPQLVDARFEDLRARLLVDPHPAVSLGDTWLFLRKYMNVGGGALSAMAAGIGQHTPMPTEEAAALLDLITRELDPARLKEAEGAPLLLKQLDLMDFGASVLSMRQNGADAAKVEDAVKSLHRLLTQHVPPNATQLELLNEISEIVGGGL